MIWLDPSNVDVFGNIVQEVDGYGPISMDLCDFVRAGKQWFKFVGER